MTRDYFRTMSEFAKGGYNNILSPAPHIYMLLVCAVMLSPLGRGGRTPPEERFNPRQERLLRPLDRIFIAGLTMLAPALGRCDPLHVSFNGWALFLLGCIAVDGWVRRAGGSG